MGVDEVLSFFQRSPSGFVLRPAIDGEDGNEIARYRLEFCFQIDEEGWMSNWFADDPGYENQEWISIV